MKALIKLTAVYGGYVWINPDYIASMARGENSTHLFIANDSSPVYIKETPEHIISLIQHIEK